MKNFGRAVRSFFLAFSRMSEDRKIKFSEKVYMVVPYVELTLVSLGIDNVQTMRLSISDAIEIFKSIKSACEMHEISEIRVGQLSWKTDARLHPEKPDQVVVQFAGPLGFAREVLKRKDILAAVVEFDKKIGLR